MLCPLSARGIALRSICMDSTVCSKLVEGPLMSMRSPMARGNVNSTTATLILEKICVMCPISIMSSSVKGFASCLYYS